MFGTMGDPLAAELPLLVVAERQTAGRGHGANRWWTGPGALAFSLRGRCRDGRRR